VDLLQPLPDYHAVFNTIIRKESSVIIETVPSSELVADRCMWRSARCSMDELVKDLLQTA
jgi:hypothetical protein